MYDYKEKATNISNGIMYMYAKTLSMFEYENLPETIPRKELELLLQRNGFAFITKVDGDLYAFNGGLGGEPDVYGNPTQIVIANPALNLFKTFELTEGVLVKNDDMQAGLQTLYERYITMLAENDVNMSLYGINTRIQTLLAASDDKTKMSAEAYIKKIIDGEIAIIGESQMMDTLKTFNANSTASGKFTDLIEYHQYLKGSLFNEIGLNQTFNQKRQRLIRAEVEQNEDALFPLVYNMYANRKAAFDEVNEMFGTEISVGFGSVWNLKNIEMQQNLGVDVAHEVVDEIVSTPLEAQDGNDEARTESVDESNVEDPEEAGPSGEEVPESGTDNTGTESDDSGSEGTGDEDGTDESEAESDDDEDGESK